MEFEEQLSAFMDGALPAEDEAELLHILSVSPDKRALFHSYLATHKAFVTDMLSATVPPHLDAAVLGGALSPSAPAAAPAAALTAWWTGRRILTAIVAGLALFTGGYYSRSLLTADESSSLSVTASGTREGGESPSRTSISARKEQPTGPGIQSVPMGETRTVYIDRIDTVYLNQPPMTHIEYRDRERIDTMWQIREIPVVTTQPVAHEFLAPPIPSRSPWDRFEVALQREHITTYPYVDYRRLEAERVQQQYAVSVAYVFDKHHAAGLTFGRKPFAQEYYTVDRDSIYLYQQQPNLFYGAGFYRFSLPIQDVITPQIGVSMGASDLGPVLGAQVAVAITPFKPLTLYVGSNAALLVYRFKDKLFTSNTLGLLYGFSVRF